jgi:hypothetical protein
MWKLAKQKTKSQKQKIIVLAVSKASRAFISLRGDVTHQPSSELRHRQLNSNKSQTPSSAQSIFPRIAAIVLREGLCSEKKSVSSFASS